MKHAISQKTAESMIAFLLKEKKLWIKQGYISQEEATQPVIINTIIELLEKGDFIAAQESFRSETKELSKNRPVYDFLAEFLREKNIFAFDIAEKIKEEIPVWIDQKEIDSREEFQPRTLQRIIDVLEKGDLPFARRLLQNEQGKIITKENMLDFLCEVLDVEK